ncbi:Kinesin-like protein KIN-12D [Linum perenne]
MLRDFKFPRRNSGKNSEEIENVPVNPRDSISSQASSELSSRPPLNTIQEPVEGAGHRNKVERTPTKPKSKMSESTLPPLRTPDRNGGVGGGVPSSKQRFGWAHRNESSTVDEARTDAKDYMMRGGLPIATPRSVRTVGRPTTSYSECTSVQSTPTKSVSKPPSSAYRSKLDASNGVGRMGNFGALYRGVPASCGSTTAIVNTAEVPHFDMKEDPSFWMDHNVQVLVRVRPLSSMERSAQGYNRCLKQESAQTISWIGQPESKFTFDHVACETVDQEMLFRMAGLPMVENCLSGYNSCIFAYGQTGSGKTHTMLGVIDGLEVKPSPQRGMTPRIFEFLFARIQAEEESRRDERLQYNCKCSFLEIYNEQITDLLDPSSTNLLLREDSKKGVYVENLSECEVQTVSDIIKLLAQGSLNRKVAATNMNRESSRSHSVFTCEIESKWEKDSTTNLRFARLNLVDLAGSERQKSSGAEGDRLKEAASINKSLSTLGHVIMILVDVANGKPRHVPYRDSRLTFLLQDSLGGNSKTMIIANVSPSVSCAPETLNTLKFAQRAKLIKNNAVVNEDSTGDVIALQHKIRLLKEEISFLKRQNVFRSLSFCSSLNDTEDVQDDASTRKLSIEELPTDDLIQLESKGSVRLSTKQLKSLESTLAGALRREQMAETAIKKLEAEVAQLNRLVRQREEDTRSTKMMLRFREDKIQRMESILGGSLPSDSYLMEENRAMCEEIQLLQAKIEKNPEVTRFALENIRLLEQIRRFQEFYEEGEREMLLDEVSKLREQLLQFLDGTPMSHQNQNMVDQTQETSYASQENNALHLKLENTADQLKQSRESFNACMEENQKLSRQIHDLHQMVENLKSASAVEDVGARTKTDTVEMEHFAAGENQVEEVLHLQLELDIMKIMFAEERSSKEEAIENSRSLTRALDLAKENLLVLTEQYDDVSQELKETKLVVEALESDQIRAMTEIEDLRKNNSHYVKLLRDKETEIMCLKQQTPPNALLAKNFEDQDSALTKKLKRMQESIEKAKEMNSWYCNDNARQASNEAEVDEVRRQAEAETVEAIICLEEELGVLQHQVQEFNLKEAEAQSSVMVLEAKLKETHDKLDLVTEVNNELLGKLEQKEQELKELTQEWELLACEMEEILSDGHEAVMDASDQLEEISSSLPEKRIWISEQVSRLIRTVSEKELLVEELGKCLEDASHQRSDVEYMIKSLRGAALVMNEAHQQECNEKEQELLALKSQLKDRTFTITELENKLKLAECHASNALLCAAIEFVIMKRFSGMNLNSLNELRCKEVDLSKLVEVNERQETLLHDQAATLEGADEEIRSLRSEIEELKKTCNILQQALSEEEKRSSSMQLQLEAIEENDILQTRERLAELKTEVLSLHHSCIGADFRDDNASEKDGTLEACARNVHTFGLTNVEKDLSSEDKNNDIKSSPKHSRNRDVTIALLKGEIESALASLQDVRTEMGRLHAEKEQFQMSERQSKETVELVTTQLLAMQATISDFEKQFELKIDVVNHKLQAFEQVVQEAMDNWSETKEYVEMEVGDAKLIASQKAAEASCLFGKFEEAQYTMKEADIMINKLVIANDTMKLEIEKQKQMELTLINEKENLIEEVQSLQAASCDKDQQLEDLERQFSQSLKDTTCIVQDLEDIVAGIHSSFHENSMSVADDLNNLKSFALDSRKMVSSLLEDVWSDIIMKDCAVTVLHHCHMGIMLETVTGLHTENGLLQHGLCETNSVIADLKERNSRSGRELQVCRTLEGKLLADIKGSFDRISRKEEETGGLGVKLTAFEKRIFDLQHQEEMMLERSNQIGSQLNILMKELDTSNYDVMETLLTQEKLLKDKEQCFNSEADILLMDILSKEFESCIVASHLKDLACQRLEADVMVECLKEEIIISLVDAELKAQALAAAESEVALLQRQVEKAETGCKDLLIRLNESESGSTHMIEANKTLEVELSRLEDIACSNDTLKREVGELENVILNLRNQIEALETDNRELEQELQAKATALENNAASLALLDQQNEKLQKDILLLESASSKLQSELSQKEAELSEKSLLEEEIKSLKNEAGQLRAEKMQVLEDLKLKSAEIESSRSSIDVSSMEKQTLQEKVTFLEASVASLQADLEMRSSEVDELEASVSSLQADLEMRSSEVDELVNSRSAIMADLCTERTNGQNIVSRVTKLEDENALLQNELRSSKLGFIEAFNRLSSRNVECLHAVETIQASFYRLCSAMEEESTALAHKIFNEFSEKIERTSVFIQEIDSLECCAENVVSENMSLQAEMSRKDDILKGMSFDLSLLQESASNTKDLKDKMEALENDLAVKSDWLDEAIQNNQALEAQLQEKSVKVSDLELELANESESLKTCSSENTELRAQIKEILSAKTSLELELAKSMSLTESLGMELSQMENDLQQTDSKLEASQSSLNELTNERHHLLIEIDGLREQLEKAEILAEENEAIAMVAKQEAESQKIHAQDKEAEVELLERSVEELECTINVLENKVDNLKEETERQRLQREDLEVEIHALKNQMQTFESSDSDMKRHLEDKEKSLEEALVHIETLKRDVTDKDAEIVQLKAHISELNLHAEAQASEYKQKFKALETMVEQLKHEGSFNNAANTSANKSEKFAVKPRGSGSPFKCIGLGLAQQIKSEKDEEMSASRLRIEELECLAASRQKEIFALHARLASAESMTHDVIRDLLGVKLDMTNYASLLNNQQLQKIAEKAQFSCLESQIQDDDIMQLKKQLQEFIEERRGWIEEINRKQTEMVAAQVALEDLRQQDQFLKAENEMLKMETVSHKKQLTELEGEVKKLSGQQNLQQRIHHHAKIKDENHALKVQNEELSSKLHRAEMMLSRGRDEIVRYRESIERIPAMPIEEKKKVMNMLKVNKFRSK